MKYNPPSKIIWDRIPTDPVQYVAITIRFLGLGVRSVGPVGDFLDFCFTTPLEHTPKPLRDSFHWRTGIAWGVL